MMQMSLLKAAKAKDWPKMLRFRTSASVLSAKNGSAGIYRLPAVVKILAKVIQEPTKGHLGSLIY